MSENFENPESTKTNENQKNLYDEKMDSLAEDLMNDPVAYYLKHSESTWSDTLQRFFHVQKK